jgi:nicotinamide-nucleotide amidase
VQAQFPQGSRPIHNPNGSAPGIDISIPRAVGNPARAFALPGVPAEMKEMWAATVAPAIQDHIGIKKVIAHYRIKCFGVGESDLEAMLPDIIARNRYPLVGITVSQATITLRVTAEGETAEAARTAMQPTIDTIHQCLGDLIYGYEEDEVADVVVRLLREQKKTLMVDEWATAGLICQWLAERDSKDVFLYGFVHTNNDWWKESGQLKTSNIDFHLVVGPQNSGATLASVLLAVGDQNHRKELPFSGHPEIVRPRLAKSALNFLRLHLLGKA